MNTIYKNPNAANQFVVTCDHDDDARLLVEGGLDITDEVWFTMRSNGFDDAEGPLIMIAMAEKKFNAFVSELIDIQARRNGGKAPSEKCVGWDADDAHPFYDKNGIK